jgi:hypothetical protein
VQAAIAIGLEVDRRVLIQFKMATTGVAERHASRSSDRPIQFLVSGIILIRFQDEMYYAFFSGCHENLPSIRLSSIKPKKSPTIPSAPAPSAYASLFCFPRGSEPRNWGGRRRQLMSSEEEKAFLQPWLEQAASGGMVVVSPIRAALAQHLKKPVAASVVYKLLARHGWRKVAPDTRHPKSDPKVQEDWKKNSRKSWQPSFNPKSSRAVR